MYKAKALPTVLLRLWLCHPLISLSKCHSPSHACSTSVTLRLFKQGLSRREGGEQIGQQLAVAIAHLPSAEPACQTINHPEPTGQSTGCRQACLLCATYRRSRAPQPHLQRLEGQRRPMCVPTRPAGPLWAGPPATGPDPGWGALGSVGECGARPTQSFCQGPGASSDILSLTGRLRGRPGAPRMASPATGGHWAPRALAAAFTAPVEITRGWRPARVCCAAPCSRSIAL